MTILTIAVGTINRLEGLQHMVQSVRDTVPSSLDVDFVIADNGSTDGTPEWVQSQSDMTLIQHGKPVGGVTALTSAGRAATGKYTLIATDDIVFVGSAIIRAIRHLEDTATCGCVTFANNHNAPSGKYTAAYHGISAADGRRVMVPYPQIAMVRTWLGNHCDWWGANTVMKGAWTYAGDNHLGYAIYNAGYTVDVVPGVVNNEVQVVDESRKSNGERHLEDARIWHEHYSAHPPKFSETPVDNPDQQQLRILYLDGFNPNIPNHKKYKKAFLPGLKEAGLVYLFDYRADIDNAPATISRIAQAWQPHLVFSNIHGFFNAAQIEAIRTRAPKAVWVNWVGDVWEHIHFDQLPLWRSMDVLLTCNADLIPRLRENGVKAYHMLGGFEDVETVAEMPAHDVVYQGNQRDGQRTQMIPIIERLRDKGVNVGVYAASGYDAIRNGNTWYDWSKVRGLNANAQIAISDNEFNASGYVSNRIWEILIAGGALCFHQTTPEFETYTGLKDGVHYIAWDDLSDLEEKVHHWLAPEQSKRRKQIARNAQRQAEKYHSFAARVKYAIEDVIKGMVDADSAA